VRHLADVFDLAFEPAPDEVVRRFTTPNVA
jgi:hypothetical protein